MPDLLCVLNHELSDNQKTEAFIKLKAKKIVEPDIDLKKIWMNISPKGELNIDELSKIIDWLKINSKKGDYVLIQGEFGATFYLVDFCFKNDLIPIYATSKREYKEIKLEDGSTKRIHIFKHVQFRKYIRFKNLGYIES